MKKVLRYPNEKAVKESQATALIQAVAMAVVPPVDNDRHRGTHSFGLYRCVFCRKKAA